MKPSRFAYLAPSSIAETVNALSAHGDEGKPLAGGQSLGPLLNLRLANPRVLIDLGRVADLGSPPYVERGWLTISAMSSQRFVENNHLVARYCPLLVEALGFVAHPTIRNRGTVGGSLAHADSAAELPAVALAGDAVFTIRGPDGERHAPAEQFFGGFFSTALSSEELLVAVRFPVRPTRTGMCWIEFAPRYGDYAIVGVGAIVELGVDGVIRDTRLAYSGVSDVPWTHPEIMTVLAGEHPTSNVLASAADVSAELCQPPDDLVGSADYRRHLVKVLTEKALARACERAMVKQ